MSERRSVLILFIGLMLCISLWRISLQESPIQTDYTSFDEFETYNNNDESSSSIGTSSISHTNNETRTTTSFQNSPITATHFDLLMKNDATNLIDLSNFDYLINQSACDDSIMDINSNTVATAATATAADTVNNKSPIVLILIHSAPGNWRKRNVIRETWGRHDPRARRYFLLGAVNSTLQQTLLNEENYMFNDIIQGNFMDAYRNMTYKHIMALKWFVYNCSKLKYLLKTDDDVFINSPAVYDFLQGDESNDTNYLFCYKNEGARVKRSYRSKWRVSTKEYTGWYYPPYCPGFSIIYSRDVVFRLYREAQQTPYFWIDDVHVTGTLARQINLNITKLGKYYMNDKQRDSIFNGKLHLIEMEPMFLFTEPNLIEKQIRKLWQITSEFKKR